jgi:hypothetical protein
MSLKLNINHISCHSFKQVPLGGDESGSGGKFGGFGGEPPANIKALVVVCRRRCQSSFFITYVVLVSEVWFG